MIRLSDLLEGLHEADDVAAELRQLREIAPGDPTVPVNLDAVLRRRSDLEAQLRDLLSWQQLDLLRYRVEQFDGSDAPAADVARSIVLFQALLTAAFDAVRTSPKRQYQPSPENRRLSSLRFALAPGAGRPVHLVIPNDGLLAIDSELDRTLDLVFELFAARAKTLIRSIAARIGIASVSAARAWADHAVQRGLTTTIDWRRRNGVPQTAAFTHTEALLFRTAIDEVADGSVEAHSVQCELLAIDEMARTFRLARFGGAVIAGDLDDGFPREGRWTIRRGYAADLLRAERIHYGTGEETVHWSLRDLTPID